MPTWTENSLNINARQRGKWEPSHMGSVDFKWTSGAVTFCRNRFYAQTVRLNQPASHESEPGDGIWVSFGYVDGSFLRSPRPTKQIFDYAWFGMIRYNSGNYVYMYIYIYISIKMMRYPSYEPVMKHSLPQRRFHHRAADRSPRSESSWPMASSMLSWTNSSRAPWVTWPMNRASCLKHAVYNKYRL